MKENEDTHAVAPKAESHERRRMLLLRAGERLFAVFAEETESVAEGLSLAPLPHAPRAVIGVASIRGRMCTVLDPNALLVVHEGTREIQATNVAPRVLVALRGDEQLALAADGDEGFIEVSDDSIAPPATPDMALHGTFHHGGTRVFVLDPSHLFDIAVHNTERRRQRQGG